MCIRDRLSLMLLSMKQKSPELEIPEGIFYDGIPNSNIYVHHKDMQSGKDVYKRQPVRS